MVHHMQPPERSPRKRDRRAAGLSSYAAGDGGGGVAELSLVGPGGTGPPLGEIQPPPPKVIRLGMFDTYQPWVLQTYGDQAKTKTITRNKYQRILQILRGDYIENETSKFKLWVKGRGFRIGPPPGYFHPTLMDTVGHSAVDYNPDKDPCPDIYVQTGTIKDAEGNDRICFKKVAIVEDFFEIVYNLHVCRDGKEQKHMGQKRTYRAVSERYAFVPREAVTKFLVLCTECPRRSVGVPVSLRNINKNLKNNNNNNSNSKNNNKSVAASTSNKINPPSITTSMGAFTSPLGASLLGSPMMGVTLASNHPGMILNSTPSKSKNNFSSVVSLVGNGGENLCFPPSSLQMARNGHFAFTHSDVISSLHHSFSDKKLSLSFDNIKMTPIPHAPLLQPLTTTASSSIKTPPPQHPPASPPKVMKTEPVCTRGPFTPELGSEAPPDIHPPPHEMPRMKVFSPPPKPESSPVKEEKMDVEDWTKQEEERRKEEEKRREQEKRAKEEEERERGRREAEKKEEEEEEPTDYSERLSALSSEIDFSLPITTLYMKHIRDPRKRQRERERERNNKQLHEGPTMGDSDGSDDEAKNPAVEKRYEQRTISDWTPYQQEQQQQPLSLSKNDALRRSPSCGSPGAPDRAGGAGTPLESTAEETSSNGNKDDEDDDNDDNDDDDKIDAHYDPERLKAFNMFVRLFVDENLDRIVPISKQPKEKIQAIIDACARQFPEFADRTRKRIRTYLKSCRRNKRTRDSNGWENSRPTPPHLTSIQAEQILATACDNESQNAKRMRLGLEPVSQPNPLSPQPVVSQSQMSLEKPLSIVDPSPVGAKLDSGGGGMSSGGAPPSHPSVLAKALERPLGEAKGVNGSSSSSLFQSSFQSSYQKVSTLSGGAGLHGQGVSMLLPSSVGVTASSSASSQVVGTSAGGAVAAANTAAIQMIPNGPTDLSLKGPSSKPANPRPSLNAVEVAAVRQLITGYRESAAFLLRSADELENLLVHQQSP